MPASGQKNLLGARATFNTGSGDAYLYRLDALSNDMLLLVLYTASIIVVSYILFDILWKE